MWIDGKTIKTTGIYNNAHLDICSICSRFDVSSLAEIQYLQMESGKGTHDNESIMLQMLFLYGSDCNRWAIENNYLLV